jgi:hypothetical protein
MGTEPVAPGAYWNSSMIAGVRTTQVTDTEAVVSTAPFDFNAATLVILSP